MASDRWARQRFYLVLAGITLLAAVLRLAWLDQTSFAFDQAQVSLRALAMARAGRFAMTGMSSSVGVPNFAAAVWFFALIYRFTTDPLVATAAVALANAAAVYGLGLVGRRAFTPAVALVAAALYALSPWAIVFSRSIWAQDLLAPLAVLWAYAGLRTFDTQQDDGTGQPWPWVALCVLAAGMAPQVHYAGVALWPATLWVLIRGRWWGRERWPGLMAGAGVALLALAPFVYALWPQRGALWTTLRAAGPGWHVSADAARGMLQMASGLEWPTIALGASGVPGGIWALQRASVWLLLAGCLAGLALLITYALCAASSPGADSLRRWTAPLIVIWAVTAPLLFTAHSTPAYHHYLLAALPAYCLATGALAARLAERRWGRVALALLLLATVAQGAFWVAGLHRQRIAMMSDANSLGLQRAVLEALPPDGPVVVATECDAHEVCDEAAVWEVRLWSREHRIIDGRHVLLLPESSDTAGAALLLSPSSGVLYESWGHGAEALGEVGPYRLARIEPGWEASLAGWEPAEPLTLSTGAQLQGWRVEREGDSVRLWTLWRVTSHSPAGQTQMFNHLIADGEKVAGADFSVSIRAWQPGDWLVTWADLPVPEGARTLAFQVGMYDLATMERAAILERPEDPERAIRLDALAP